MKLALTFVALVTVCSLSPLRGQEGQDIIMPSSRKTVPVAEAERNPFANVEKPKVETPTLALDAKSEAGRIEAVLDGLAVVGRTRGPAGWKVLLGDLILEAGKTLPPVIEAQTQVLRVAAIYDTMIEIEWVSKDAREIPKRIFVVVQLAPTVGSALSGQLGGTSKTAQPLVITQPLVPPPAPPDAIPVAQ